MSEPPDERFMESDTLYPGNPRIPVWFWPVIVLIAAVFIAAMVTKGAGASAVSEPTSPHMEVTNDIVLTVRGLTPGTPYDVTVMVYGSENDPAPYCLGYGGAFIGSRGRLTLDYDMADLIYASQRTPYEVKVWLRPPNSACGAAPSVDESGLPLFKEYDFYEGA